MALICDVCGGTPEAKIWGHYQARQSSFVPYDTVCMQCLDAVAYGAQPLPPPPWHEMSAALALNPAGREQIQQWAARSRTQGPLTAGVRPVDNQTSLIQASSVAGNRQANHPVIQSLLMDGRAFAASAPPAHSAPPAQPANSKRLKQQLSDPQDPPEARPSKKKGRPSTASTEDGQQTPQAQQTSCAGRRHQPKKADAPPFTVENILKEMFDQPKVNLSWKLSSYRTATQKGGVNASELFTEKQKLDQLQAAINLLPGEVTSLSDSEYNSAVETLFLVLNANQLPLNIVHHMVLRFARSAMDRRNPAGVLEYAWGWGQAMTFDPRNPRLRDFAQLKNGSDKLEVLRKTVDIISKDYMAKLMSSQALRKSEIVELAGLLRIAAQPTITEEKSIVQEVLDVALAVAAIVQSTACTQDQISALRRVSDMLESKAGADSAAQALLVFWNDPWWLIQQENVWKIAADEGAAAPQIAKILEALAGEADGDSVDEAWKTAELRLKRWSSTLREGATQQMVSALRSNCQNTVLGLTSEGAPIAATDWVQKANIVTTRLLWLQDFVDCRELLEPINKLMDKRAAVAKFETGMQHVRRFHDIDSEEEQETVIRAIKEAFALRSSETLEPEDVDDVQQFLKMCAEMEEIVSVDLADACMAMSKALALADNTHQRLAADWAKTARAVHFLPLAARVNESGAADVFDICFALLHSWKAELGTSATAGLATSQSSFMDGVLGQGTGHIESAVKQVETYVTKRIENKISAIETLLNGAIDNLEKLSKGRHNKSWKENLSEESTYEEVEREAMYHLVDEAGQHFHKAIDQAMTQLQTALDSWTAAMTDLANSQVSSPTIEAKLPADMQEKKDQAIAAAQITHTESFFFDLLTNSSSPDRARKVQHRMESMSSLGITSDAIQTQIWRKILLVSSRSRRQPPGTPCVKQTK